MPCYWKIARPGTTVIGMEYAHSGKSETMALAREYLAEQMRIV